MQQINLIVSCTNRKKATVPDALRLRSVPISSTRERLQMWLRRLAEHETAERPAADLYAGDHWQVAQTIPQHATGRGMDVRLWVCSAGYGLVPGSAQLKPYSATFAPGHPDSVVRTTVADQTNGEALREWWVGLEAHSTSEGTPGCFRQLAEREPGIPILLVTSEPYLLAMAADLAAAAKHLVSPDLLSILSVGANAARLPGLEVHLLPGDARYEAVVGGTRAALNIRIARLLLQKFRNGDPTTTGHFASMLNEMASELPPLRRFERRKLSDEEVRRYIFAELKTDPSTSKTRLLGKLRGSGVACEQSRFSAIFSEVVKDLKNAP